jgi:two-component system NtrC family sensor kinase
VENLRVGKTAYAFILNRKGELQTRAPLDSGMCKDCFAYFIEKMENAAEPVQVFERIDHADTSNIYVVGNLKNGDWMLIFKQE